MDIKHVQTFFNYSADITAGSFIPCNSSYKVPLNKVLNLYGVFHFELHQLFMFPYCSIKHMEGWGVSISVLGISQVGNYGEQTQEF